MFELKREEFRFNKRGDKMVDFTQAFNQSYPDQWEKFSKIAQKMQNMINYQFSTISTLYDALSIRGAKLSKEAFERLEFLGDSLLKAIQGIMLFDKSDEFGPGDLTKLRSNLENNINLARLAAELPFNELSMLLGIGQLSSNQAADCFEALIGAIYLDNGRKFDPLIDIVRRITHFDKNIKLLKSSPWGAKDPKSFLHEWAAKPKQFGTDFEISFPAENRGKANAPEFYVHAVIKRKSTGKIELQGDEAGPASKVKDGEKEAAKKLLEKLQSEGKLDN